MGGLPAKVLSTLSRNCVPSVTFPVLTCLFPETSSLPGVMDVPFSTRGAAGIKNLGFLTAGAWWALTGHSPHPSLDVTLLGAIALGLLCWGRGSAGKFSTFSFIQTCIFSSFWNFSFGRLNFYRFFLIHWYFPGPPLSKFSPGLYKRDWDKFTGCADSTEV